MSYPDPAALDDVMSDTPDTLDANEWAEWFARCDAAAGEDGLDMDGLAACFAAALRTGQLDPTGDIIYD